MEKETKAEIIFTLVTDHFEFISGVMTSEDWDNILIEAEKKEELEGGG